MRNRNLIANGNNNYCAMIIDMQLKYYGKDKHQDEIGSLVKQQLKILDFCDSNEFPVILVEMEGERKTHPFIYDRVLRTQKKALCTKSHLSAFCSHQVLKALIIYQTQHIIMMGINASECISFTLDSALEYDLKVSSAADLIRDCRFSRSVTPGDSIYQSYVQRCANFTLTTEELLERISRDLKAETCQARLEEIAG